MKALEIDNNLAEAHTALADVGLLYEWDWSKVERDFRVALELNPHYATAHQWYGNYLAAMGRLDESVAETKVAQTIDPLSLIISSALGSRLYLARRFGEALEQFSKTLEMDPNFGNAHIGLAKVYLQKGMHTEAKAEGKKALALSEENQLILAAMGHIYAVSGDTDQAVKVLRKLEKLSKQKYVSSYDVAVVYAGLGKNDEAFEWLEKAYAERASYLIFLSVDASLDGLGLDPRFANLVRHVGLPQ